MTARKSLHLVPKLRFPEFHDVPKMERLGILAFLVAKRIHYNEMDRLAFISTDNMIADAGGIEFGKVTPVSGSAFFFSKGDILFSNIRTYLRKVWLADRDGICSNDILIFRGKPEFIDSGFLFQVIAGQDFTNYSIRTSKGTKMPRGDKMSLLDYRVALPSLEEQRRIADCLRSLDDLIAAEGRKLDALRQHKQGMMQQLFPRPGETEPRLRFPDFQDDPPWLAPSFADLYRFKRSNSLSRDKLNYVTGAIRNIHYGDIHTKFKTLFRISSEYVPYINPDTLANGFDDGAFCEEGDIVLADASEDLDDVGKAIEVVSLDGEHVVAGTHTILATRRGSIPVVGFGGQLFQSAAVRAGIKKEAQGTKVCGISAKRVSAVTVPIPPTEVEQQKIADCLGSLDDLIAVESRKLEARKKHKQGLLQQLFPMPEPT